MPMVRFVLLPSGRIGMTVRVSTCEGCRSLRAADARLVVDRTCRASRGGFQIFRVNDLSVKGMRDRLAAREGLASLRSACAGLVVNRARRASRFGFQILRIHDFLVKGMRDRIAARKGCRSLCAARAGLIVNRARRAGCLGFLYYFLTSDKKLCPLVLYCRAYRS